MHALIVILCYLFFSSVAQAKIYECISPDGITAYQDKKCPAGHTLKRQLVYNQPEMSVQKLRDIQQQMAKYRNALDKQAMRKLREVKCAEKKREQEKRRRMRLRARCDKVKQKIVMLEQRYKQGHTTKQRLALDQKLADCVLKKQEYCVDERA